MSLRLTLGGLIVAAALVSPVAAEDLSGIQWMTNMDDPPIGDPAAKKGGTLYTYTTSYPLTQRLIGPNANDAMAGWRRSFTMDFGLITLHPTTDNIIPILATHWAVMDDNKTLYFKLDPDARWSDGEPITADDYVFTLEMMRSPYIVDPFYNQYAEDQYESVEKLDDYTLKIVGKFASWRPLVDFSIFPMPEHQITLDENYVEAFNNVLPLSVGPYTITETKTNQYVVYTRDPNWWGYDKHYYQGVFNVDKIHIRVIQDSDPAFDFFKKGELSYYRVNTAKKWAQEMDFEAIKKGWAHKKRVFVDFPQGLYGFAMNLEKPIFQNKDFRKAVQYLFNFDEINEKLMYNAYYRAVSAFEGSQYENEDLKPYGFDPRKARDHLTAAGYTTRGSDGILVDADGNRASFTLSYGQKGLERHFTVVKQTYQRFGVEMNLRLLEPGTYFANGLERQYEMTIMSRTSSFYPGPHQYFASVFKETTNNNNIWSFGTAYTDSLIDVYRFDLDKEKRVQAMHELDRIIQDEAFYAPFWQAPFIRMLYWDHVQWPEFYFPKRTEQLLDYQVFWIDTEKEQILADAMKSGTPLTGGQDLTVDVDPYGVKERLEASMSGRDDRAAAR